MPIEQSNENFKVVARIRPPLEREIEEERFISTVFNSDGYLLDASGCGLKENPSLRISEP